MRIEFPADFVIASGAAAHDKLPYTTLSDYGGTADSHRVQGPGSRFCFNHTIVERTGLTINTLGKDARVDLGQGVPRARSIHTGTPGRVFENLVNGGAAPGYSNLQPAGRQAGLDMRRSVFCGLT